jgi:hypothetical protein
MKTFAIILAGLFCVHTGLQAQDNQVRVQSSPDAGEQTFSTFYFMDATDMDSETTLDQDAEFNQRQEDGVFGQDRQDQEGVTDQEGQQDRAMDQQREGTTGQHDRDGMAGQQHHREGMTGQHHDGMGMMSGADEVIRDAVLHEMVRRGFEIDSENPDLLVSFKVFDQSAEISGFTQDEGLGGAGTGAGVGTGMQTPETFEVGEGTILITVIERETGQMISRGFLSEALTDFKDDRAMHDDQDRQAGIGDEHRAEKYDKKVEVIQAVSSIFEQLQLGDTGTLGAGRQ